MADELKHFSDDIKHHFDTVSETRREVRLIAERVGSLERRMAQEFATLRDEMRSGFDELKAAVRGL